VDAVIVWMTTANRCLQRTLAEGGNFSLNIHRKGSIITNSIEADKKGGNLHRDTTITYFMVNSKKSTSSKKLL